MKAIVAIASLVLVTNGAAHAQPVQKSAADCGADQHGKFMNMSPKEFDQTLDEGWRVVGDAEGCERAAADLIAMYRDEVLAQDMAGLDWHEAQLRAATGDTEAALTLFRRNLVFRRKLANEIGDTADVLDAEATIAYLERDLPRLQAKRAELAALPKPDWFDALAADYAKHNPDAAASMAWPRNLNVVDGFIACFDKPYREAYSFACQPKPVQ
ncbi:MAG: hypothetical protein B7Y90_06170 [Alphaproteobacteria bacterium 32-64-14]|nr:MAG: hypothetical protein B7Y90_06170 [Alphaproteobacteria bacterium 32-64-14]